MLDAMIFTKLDIHDALCIYDQHVGTHNLV